jgi:hypothetical protein
MKSMPGMAGGAVDAVRLAPPFDNGVKRLMVKRILAPDCAGHSARGAAWSFGMDAETVDL